MRPYDPHGDNTELLEEIYHSSTRLKQDFDKWSKKDWYGVADKLQDILRLLMQTQEAQIMQEKRLVEMERGPELVKKLPRPPGYR
jgi:hypothetical protein